MRMNFDPHAIIGLLKNDIPRVVKITRGMYTI